MHFEQMASKMYIPAAAFAADIDREKRSVLLLFSISFAKTLFVMNERCCKRLDFFQIKCEFGFRRYLLSIYYIQLCQF